MGTRKGKLSPGDFRSSGLADSITTPPGDVLILDFRLLTPLEHVTGSDFLLSTGLLPSPNHDLRILTTLGESPGTVVRISGAMKQCSIPVVTILSRPGDVPGPSVRLSTVSVQVPNGSVGTFLRKTPCFYGETTSNPPCNGGGDAPDDLPPGGTFIKR